MSDAMAVSALGGVRFKGAIMVVEEPPRGMVTVRSDLSSKAMARAVGKIPDPRGIEGDVLWMSPDELLVLCAYSEAAETALRMEAALAGSHSLVANVSDARAMFTLSGAGLREVVAKLTPADLSPEALQPGALRRTRLAQVPVAFWMSEETVLHMICFRSVARYVFDLLAAAADPSAELTFF